MSYYIPNPIFQEAMSINDLYWTEEDIDFLDIRNHIIASGSVHIGLEYADTIKDFVAFRYIYLKNPALMKQHIKMTDILGYNVFNLSLKKQHNIFEILEKIKK